MTNRIERFRSQQREERSSDVLPTVPMGRRGMPRKIDLQAEHTATLPNVLVWNWPLHLRDDLYEWCWANHHAKQDVEVLLEKLSDRDVWGLVDKLDSFELEHLTAIGARLYEGLVDQYEKRSAEKPQIRVCIVEQRPSEFKQEAREVEAEVVQTFAKQRVRLLP